MIPTYILTPTIRTHATHIYMCTTPPSCKPRLEGLESQDALIDLIRQASTSLTAYRKMMVNLGPSPTAQQVHTVINAATRLQIHSYCLASSVPVVTYTFIALPTKQGLRLHPGVQETHEDSNELDARPTITCLCIPRNVAWQLMPWQPRIAMEKRSAAKAKAPKSKAKAANATEPTE